MPGRPPHASPTQQSASQVRSTVERPRAKAGYRRRDALKRGRQGVSDGLFAISVRIYIGDPRPAGVPGRISWRVARSIMQLH